MADLGVGEVTLIGGEAYLREDWTQIIAHIRKRGMACSITTGARNLTRERILAAKDAGLQSVSISVDGLRDAHDQLRASKGSFDAAMEAFRTIAEVGGIRATANSQVNRVNFHDLPALLETLADAGVKAWQMALTTAMGRAGDEPDILLEPYHMLWVLPLMAQLKKRSVERGVALWPGNNIGYFGPHETALRGHYPKGHRGSCGAGRISLGIEANGDIKGCPSLPSRDYVGGNVRDHALVDIWERSGALRMNREPKETYLKGFCATCYYADECRGGCHWTSHVLLGERGDNPYCHHRALELLASGVRERIQKGPERGPKEPFDYTPFTILREPWTEAERALAQGPDVSAPLF